MWIGYANKYIFLDFSDSVDMFIIVSKNPELYSDILRYASNL